MHNFSVGVNDIEKAVKRLKNNFAMGTDGIPAFLVKDCIGALAEPLEYIFNTSLKSSTFPDIWKISKVVPVHKSGDRSEVENYRGIAITSNFGKIFEACITCIVTYLHL